MAIKHFSHHHLLVQLSDDKINAINNHHHHDGDHIEHRDNQGEVEDNDDSEAEGIWCAMCGGTKPLESFYGCEECEFYLHKRCAELPEQIQHQFHPQHPLSLLLPDSPGSHRCQICSGFARPEYNCSICDFWLDLSCAFQKPTVSFPYKDHLLHLFDNIPHLRRMVNHFTCDECERDDDGFIFVCVVPFCNYSVHIHCAPISLPETIKHDCHCHPLAFAKCFPQLGEESSGDEEDSAVFICDACEYKGNKHFPVYYCDDCEFITHLSCAVSEELPSLVAKYQSEAVVVPRKVDRKLAELHDKKKGLIEYLKEIEEELTVMKDKRDRYVSSSSPALMKHSATETSRLKEQCSNAALPT